MLFIHLLVDVMSPNVEQNSIYIVVETSLAEAFHGYQTSEHRDMIVFFLLRCGLSFLLPNICQSDHLIFQHCITFMCSQIRDSLDPVNCELCISVQIAGRSIAQDSLSSWADEFQIVDAFKQAFHLVHSKLLQSGWSSQALKDFGEEILIGEHHDMLTLEVAIHLQYFKQISDFE